MIGPHRMKLITPISPGDNAMIEVHGSLDGGVRLIIKDAKHPMGYPVTFTKENAIKIALTMLQAAGVPINENLQRHEAERRAALASPAGG